MSGSRAETAEPDIIQYLPPDSCPGWAITARAQVLIKLAGGWLPARRGLYSFPCSVHLSAIPGVKHAGQRFLCAACLSGRLA